MYYSIVAIFKASKNQFMYILALTVNDIICNARSSNK